VIMLEDVVTSGGSLLRAISRVEEAGLKVLASMILVARMEGGREAVEKAGHKLISLFSRHDFLPNKP
ncbi:MAG: orotate phosphoribosyltransferase, partial [Chloroflexi bacterium]